MNHIERVESMKEINSLVEKLNSYRDAYYNYNQSLVEDSKYDELFDRLKKLEQETGYILFNSPTQTVGYEVQSKLNKVKHDHPMLSLDKTKEVEDIIKFANRHSLIGMLKMDGLTCSIHYDENGNYVSAETRGNGEVGEDITLNAMCIQNLPKKIPSKGKPYVIDGEVIIDKRKFEEINAELPEDEQYAHCRNLASGTIRQLDTKVTAEREPKFVAWRVIEGEDINSFQDALYNAEHMGFEVVPFCYIPDIISSAELEESIFRLKNLADDLYYPIDGLVFSYNDIKYGLDQGMTGHHPNHSIAFKFGDDTYETVLRDIEWSTSRTGQVNPVAVFDMVDLDGAETTRATLHNVSVMKNLELGIGDTITVYRANQVIPKVDDNLTRSNTYVYPDVCPSCGEKLEIRKDGIAEVLFCVNDDCPAKILSKFVHFVSKHGMNIDGLSESTLEKLIDRGYITKYADLYHLEDCAKQIQGMDGFGKKSYEKLIKSIEKSREVKLENLLVALGIPLIGRTASKTISKYFKGDWNKFIEAVTSGMDFTELEDFGDSMNQSLYDFADQLNHHYSEQLYYKLFDELEFIEEEEPTVVENDFINGKTFCVTGKFETMKRSDIEKIITDRGGKLSGSVSKKTDYLLTNESDSGSSKAKKAKELGTPIMSESEFIAKVFVEETKSFVNWG